MATNHTENYQLNLWEPQDSFLREEFNENTEKLDAALETYKTVAGSYTADSTQKEIHLGFRPKLVVLLTSKSLGVISENTAVSFYRHPDRSVVDTSSVYGWFTDNGFVINSNDSYFNGASYSPTVYYVAFR